MICTRTAILVNFVLAPLFGLGTFKNMGNKFSKPARVAYKRGKRAKLSSGGDVSNLAALEVLKGAQGVHISNFHVTVAGGDVVNNTYHNAPGSAAITDADKGTKPFSTSCIAC
ncbi:hypothetical protein FA15DRAFT_676030 [Coprinopsis marcescibilis]|uniref:Uncharacterized protein n=1 Tax=Coprinopsis marcescibilis TaxID=230819 RepID=A0A5C3KBZ4_COPMA|nr:hypothetical protein FA15DRAFT_676030 [Coprinopsis marcescibilis]